MDYSKKSYCGGVFCNKKDRKIKCISCHVHVCNVCSVDNECIDCYVHNSVKLFTDEFNNMLIDLKLKSKEDKKCQKIVNPLTQQ